MLKALTRSAAIALVATVAWAQAAAPATIGDTAKGKALVNRRFTRSTRMPAASRPATGRAQPTGRR